MEIFRFRALANEEDFKRVKQILETGHFWCSQFTELNDPMEGVFTAIEDKDTEGIIEKIFDEKNKFKICSFSGEPGFKNPLMWGYYANGFRGIAIKVKVPDNMKDLVTEVDYKSDIQNFKELYDIKKILTTKLLPWEKENEYRFLKDSKNNLHEIGKIMTVYFGNPYDGFSNQKQIIKNNESLKKYEELKEKLGDLAINKGIWVSSVKVNGCEVEEVMKDHRNKIFKEASESEFRSRKLLFEDKALCPNCGKRIDI